MATIITLTNQKGGVGKTTTSCALATGLGKAGQRVLGIDLDPQGNFAFSLGQDSDDGDGVYEVLTGRIPVKEAIRQTECCDVIPSNILLSSFNDTKSQYVLKTALEDVLDDYDYIIIDTPPSLNILTVNAYTAADFLIIPMSSDILSLVGVTQLKETVDSVRASYNKQLKILGILLTRYNKRTLLSQEVDEMAQQLAVQLGTCVFETKIRNGVAAAEAPAHGECIFDYAPRSNPAKDYLEFIKEVVIRMAG